MARTRITPHKTTAVRPAVIGRTDSFYSFKMGEQQNMVRFLNQFQQRWAAVREHGVTELDGLLQLVQALPSSWRGWASEAALDFVHPDMEVRVTGNLIGFIDLIKEQFHLTRNPPPGQYPSLDQFIPTVHQILSDILAPREDSVNSDTDEPIEVDFDFDEHTNSDFSENRYLDIDRDYAIESEMTFIELELYGQPFALNPPSPLIFPLTPPPEVASEPPSVNIGIESESQFSVGTSRIQPLPISEMPFNTDPSIFTSGEPVNSSTSRPLASEEIKPEISEEKKESDEGNIAVDRDSSE